MRVGAVVVVRAVQVPSLSLGMIAAAPDGIAITATIRIVVITQGRVVAARRGQEVAMAQVCGRFGVVHVHRWCRSFLIHGPIEQAPPRMMGAGAMVIESPGTPLIGMNIITNITLTIAITISVTIVVGIGSPSPHPLFSVFNSISHSDAAQPRIDAPGR